MSLDKEFSDSGLTALLGCGATPGLSNVVASYYCHKMDEIDSIKIRCGGRKTDAGKYDDFINPWNPGWSPIQALKDCNDSPMCFKDGQYKLLPPYYGLEECEFSEPI